MDEGRVLACCFTGHRKMPEELDSIETRAEECIRELYARGVREFRVGGAVGFDTMMAKLLFRLREDMPDIKILLFYPFDGFTDGWDEAQKALFAELLPKYDEAHCLSEQGGADAYLARDRALVDGAAYCIAFCRDTGGRSGTAYTVRYAQRQGVKVKNLEERGK